ncbi:MAG: hypothetical protein RL095_860 [Verrucomicrobiota bacterium]|jgi:ADP-ribose pyrophosphatase YjhB (NUDIX family)/cytosine/adenosine deaminase-related metal-dependent hydrolase
MTLTHHSPLTQDRQRSIELSCGPEGGSLRLLRAEGSRRSALDRALASCLRLELDGVLQGPGAEFKWSGEKRQVRLLLGETAPFVILEASAAGCRSYRLSSFESRYLAENGRPHPSPGLISDEKVPWGLGTSPQAGSGAAALGFPRSGSEDSGSPEQEFCGLRTDLHCHFAGCLLGQDLLDLALQEDLSYPLELLRDLGLGAGEGQVPLRSLPPHTLAALALRLSIPADRQIPFADMSGLYRYRSPLTKHPRLLAPMLARIAADYRAMGVDYAELSVFNVLEAAFFATIHEVLPEIERDTGVRLRFLAALGRHDDYEWDLDCLERLKQLAASPFLVGIDFMGHETNSTAAFAPQLRAIAAWASEARPGFALRVHAGENPAHPENIRLAAACVEGLQVQLRIGHGLYGLDEETLELLRRTRAIVELNLSSNFALNNVHSAADIPLRRYLDAGIEVVLGTDGYGLYQTDLAMELQSARLCGLRQDDLPKLIAAERRYLALRDGDRAFTRDDFAVPPEFPPRHYGPEVRRRRDEERRQRRETLEAALARLAVPLLDEEGLADLMRQRRCWSIAGAWRHSWARLSETERQAVEDCLIGLLAIWDPAETLLICGGTGDGVEGLLQRLAAPRGFAVLGTLVEETPPESLLPGGLSQACILARSLYDKSAALYQLLKRHGGGCLFFGGGMIVADEIRAAANLRLPLLLFDAVPGAAARAALQMPDCAFRKAGELRSRLLSLPLGHGSAEAYWHPGPNPTVDIILWRQTDSGREVLLLRRREGSDDEPGRWGLPGGFQLSAGEARTPWQGGRESAPEACRRKLREDCGLEMAEDIPLIWLGDYEGGGRDPRDSAFAWSRSRAFTLKLEAEPLWKPGPKVAELRWFSLAALPRPLAFDHGTMLDEFRGSIGCP